MSAASTSLSATVERLRSAVVRLVSIADDPADDDGERLRKRVGVAAGYLTVVAPLSLPLQARGIGFSSLLAGALAAVAIVNLLILARTRSFDRYVIGLISAGVVFVPLATLVGGGILGSSPGLVWGFLVPAYAILALGPRRAMPWFVAYLGIVVVMAVLDPIAHDAISPPYPFQLAGHIVNAVIPLAIVFFLLLYTDTRRRAAEARADELLTNAIPGTIARRLKHGESRIAETYPDTTVLFADLAGFTPWAQRTPAADVVAALDDLFTRFDELTARHGLEKVKTIGDAYMAVAGAPQPRADHALAALALARAMLTALAAWRDDRSLALGVRIGIASGSVVAGVIGQRRLLFDLWGDTVNLASRLESAGVPGRIQVAQSTRELVGEAVDFEARDVEIKGIGAVRAYLLADPT